MHQEVLKKYKADLKQKEATPKRQQKFRVSQKSKGKLGQNFRESLMKNKKNAENAELIAAISRIAISGSAAHERRRSEIIRTVETLDQLTDALNREGYTLKRSAVYLHLLPRNAKTRERKRHVTTAPVKLISAKTLKPSIHQICQSYH